MPIAEAIVEKIRMRFPAIKQNEILAPYTNWKVGGPAELFLHPDSYDMFVAVLEMCKEMEIPCTILGGGANVLIADRGIEGLVIRAGGRECFKSGENEITADAGVPLSLFLNAAAKEGLTMPSMDLMVGIPGTVGGSIFGNAGGRDFAIGNVTKEVMYWTVEKGVESIPGSECEFTYRSSRFKKHGGIILRGIFTLEKGDPMQIRTDMQRGLQEKRAHQPLAKATAGSVFQHPEGHTVWKLIDEAGLRGKQIGGAKISEMHANFIENTGNATAEQIVMLISYIKQQVRDKFGVQLQEEIRYIGF